MSGHHVVVYAAPIKCGWSVPGHAYFVSIGAQVPADYDVYVQYGPAVFPVTKAFYHGRVGAMTMPLPYWPEDQGYQVDLYYANYQGTVDCYTWRPGYSSHM